MSPSARHEIRTVKFLEVWRHFFLGILGASTQSEVRPDQ
jgi:hypothetical protein